jgi:hypothetical protein
MQPEWMRALRVGDVLTRNGRTYRVVRTVTFKPNGNLHAISFAIKRRSWTGRPCTTYMASDLKTFGFRPVGARVKLTSELDQRLAQYIANHEIPGRRPFPDRYSVTPEDVRGVA